ncbi:MAG TPA: hypothetical protein VM243_00675 [Phycisphaerae bacterium]|nr:hypothetical protein [Phycisphaerae bacterium]
MSVRVAVLILSAVLLPGTFGCSGAEFGESAALPQGKHASLTDEFAAGRPLALPADMPLNLYDSQRRATAAGRAESSAAPEGRAACRVSADGVGTAAAEFQLGHVLDNRGQGPLKVTARFAVDYACRVEADPDDRSKPDDKLGLRLFIRDSNRRVLQGMMLTEVGQATGPREWSGRESHALDVVLEPGLAYYFVLAGKASVTGTEVSTASAEIDVRSFALELVPRE